MHNPQERERLVRTHAQLATQLQAAILERDASACLPLMAEMITDDFPGLERNAIPGELPVRMQLHEIIDDALRNVVFADDTPCDTWKEIVLHDNWGLYKHYPIAANGRWLRMCGSKLVDQGLEAIDAEAIAAIAKLDLRGQALRLARFCAVNDGAATLDYAALRAVLDPRLVAYLNDWLLCIALCSPRRMHDPAVNANQDALRVAFINAHRTPHKPLAASSDQAFPTYVAAYSLDESTRALAIECGGNQMTALMQSFKPSAEACQDLAEDELPVHALDELPDTDALIVCPNWTEEHVIYRCMSPLVEGLRERGVPLLRVVAETAELDPVPLEWYDQTVDFLHINRHTLSHLGALDHALQQRKYDFLFYPEVTSSSSAYWMATERIARVQATGYGFPMTTGMRTMDYFIGGADVEGPQAGDHYAEQLILLPGLGVGTTKPPAPTVARELDPDRLNVVATTSLYKLNVELMQAWSELLSRFPNATLHLFTNFTPAQVQVYLPALQRWLPKGDIRLNTTVPRQTIIDTLAQADLFLDAYPYGGFNSLVEPLSVGCPVLTVEGTQARNRLGAALLRRAGFDESVISHSLPEFVDAATRILGDAGERRALDHVLTDRSAVLERLDDPELPHHMDAAVTWMRHNGPTKSRRAPVMIRAGEQPVSLSA